MKFKVLTESAEYLDDTPNICFEYESSDVLDFSAYVQSAVQKVKDLMNFDANYRDTFQVTVSIYIDGELRATDYYRRSETENKTIINWRLIHPLP